MNSKQRGMIKIPYEIVRENPEYVFAIFQELGFLPVEIEFRMNSGMMLYTGYSREFQECHYNESPKYCGVLVTANEKGRVIDAVVTFNGESDFGDWKRSKACGVPDVPDAALKAISEGRDVCLIDLENRCLMSSYGRCAPASECQEELNTGELLESDFLEGIKDGHAWIACMGYDTGETQYGSGYGNVMTIPGYYMWELLQHIPPPKPEEEPVEVESTEPF